MQKNEQLTSIQTLRGLAAMAVVTGHCWLFGYWQDAHLRAQFPGLLLDGSGGVDLFFVISGFIMVHASRSLYGKAGARKEFMRRRLTRIAPLYWIVTLFLFGWLSLIQIYPTQLQVLFSLLFIPYSADGSTTHIAPIVIPGWTLAFEMLFYGIFALCLSSTALKSAVKTSLLLIVLIGLGYGLPQAPPAWAFAWTRPLLAEFIAGMALAIVWQRGWQCPRWMGGGLIIIGLAALLIPLDPAHHWQDWHRVQIRLPAATAALAGAVLVQNSAQSKPIWAKFAALLGDASYSIYLWHMPLLLIMKPAHEAFPILSGIAFTVLAIMLSLAIGIMSYLRLEKPMIALFNRRA